MPSRLSPPCLPPRRGVRRFALAAIALSAALSSGLSHAESWFEPVRLGAAAGAGNDASMARLEGRWDLKHDLWATSSQSLRLRLGVEASAGIWNPHGSGGNTLGDLGLTPILRLQGGGSSGVFVEAGVGVHVLSRTHISDEKVFSTAFQFGDRVAVGYRFGDALDSELALRLQHYSNAGIKEPNPGINFFLLQYSARF
ncbi:acyloxyacyl hydrolase [Cupriavidus sp. WKF15]|uniref:acyloxyacyl hydrolase n=1 Tax=Cupriavidus sp. WKF15 TaxID=3032282 RepID=UPI0023E0B8EE|nr:acyloxyacyl hydrolase [Cupriavidus sp. WKF15]WER48093.1 acyloxyacyl hydrolase [Cupriavidus sp. WKF15]